TQEIGGNINITRFQWSGNNSELERRTAAKKMTDHRGGPGCLNRFSASIGGASAGVRLPCGEAAWWSKLDWVSYRQDSNAASGRYTTRFENAHGTEFRELLYRWHPWFGLRVCIHEEIDKADG